MSEIPPHDHEAEQALLSALFINPELDVGETGLAPDAFYSGAHREIFTAILSLVSQSRGLDIVNVGTELKNTERLNQVGGMEYLTDLLNLAPRVGSAAVAEYADTIKTKHKVRRVIEECRLAMAKAYHGECDAGALVEKIHSLETGLKKVTAVSMKDALKTTFKRIVDHANSGGGMTGISTGFPDLDTVVSGWHPGDFTIVAGRPGMGKSAFAQACLVNIARGDRGTILFNLEMPTYQTATRIICAEAKVDLTHPRQGKVTDADFRAMAPVLSPLAQMPMLLDDNGAADIGYIRAVCKKYSRELEREGKTLFAIGIDYLQLVNVAASKAGNREQQIAEVSRFCKLFAKEMNIVVIGLAQLNRGLEARSNKRPMLSDLRESGSLEQDADVVMFLYRDEVYDKDSDDSGVAEVIIGKQRNGPCDTVRLQFEKESAAFRNFAAR